MKVLVTGSSGLIGSEMVVHFDAAGRPGGRRSTTTCAPTSSAPRATRAGTCARLRGTCPALRAPRPRRPRPRRAWTGSSATRARSTWSSHCAGAAEPRPGRAAARSTTSTSTPPARSTCSRPSASARPEAVFVLLSTNKVYGDAPNELPLVELETRWDYARPEHAERRSTSRCASTPRSTRSSAPARLAADVMTQEYGRYFGLRTHCLRGGCLTGPEPQRRRAARLPLLPRQVPARGPALPHLRATRASRCATTSTRTTWPARSRRSCAARAGRGLQPRRRPGELLLDPRGLRARRGAHRQADGYEYVDAARARGDHICYITNLAQASGAHYPGLAHHAARSTTSSGARRGLAGARSRRATGGLG